MRRRANVVKVVALAMMCAACLLSIASTAAGEGAEAAARPGEDRWVPSFAIISGVTVQKQKGKADSFLIPGATSVPVELRPTTSGDELAVSPFVGGSLEIMTPTLQVPTRPRFFLAGEILPTFAAERDLAVQGKPGCVRGPEVGAPCAKDEDPTVRNRPFGEDGANGRGSQTSAQVERWVFGANVGVAWPFEFMDRKLSVKSSFGWINYKVRASGLVVDVECSPSNRCTSYTPIPGQPPIPGFFREIRLSGDDRQRFNGIGPGLDLEMEAARYGPVLTSLFVSARAYYILDDQAIRFSNHQSYSDQIGDDQAEANWRVTVDDWMYRANVGIRFSWLGQD